MSRIQDTILSILEQTMRHKAGETIAQFSLDTGPAPAASLPSQKYFQAIHVTILFFILLGHFTLMLREM